MKLVFNIFLIALFSMVTIQGSAQGRNQATLQPGIAVNIGPSTTNSPFGYGIGIDFLLKYELSEVLKIDGSFGYMRLLTKDTSPIRDYDFLPLKTTLKIFPFAIPIYFNGTIGTGFGIQKGSKNSLIFGGGMGYQFSHISELSLRYEGYQQPFASTSYHPLNGLYALTFSYYLSKGFN